MKVQFVCKGVDGKWFLDLENRKLIKVQINKIREFFKNGNNELIQGSEDRENNQTLSR